MKKSYSPPKDMSQIDNAVQNQEKYKFDDYIEPDNRFFSSILEQHNSEYILKANNFIELVNQHIKKSKQNENFSCLGTLRLYYSNHIYSFEVFDKNNVHKLSLYFGNITNEDFQIELDVMETTENDTNFLNMLNLNYFNNKSFHSQIDSIMILKEIIKQLGFPKDILAAHSHDFI